MTDAVILRMKLNLADFMLDNKGKEDFLAKHLVDWVLADFIDNYMQRSGKLDKYGFSLLPA